MKLIDLVGDNKVIEEQLQYIHNAFRKEFPEINFDERNDIVGVGEPNKHLLCYFKKQKEDVYVKFKCELEPKKLPQSKEEIDCYVKQTIELFNKNDFTLKKKQKRSGVEGSVNRQKREKKTFCQYDKELNYANSLEQLKEENELYQNDFEQRLKELKVLLTTFINRFVFDETEKDIVFSLLKLNHEGKTLRKLAEEHGDSYQHIGIRFRRQLRTIAKHINLQNERSRECYELRNEFMDKFCNFCIDSFMMFLAEKEKTHFVNAFATIFVPRKQTVRQLLRHIYNSRKTIKQSDKILKVKYEDFTVFASGDGVLLTDIDLLNKLKAKRLQLANERGALENWIYTNKQLVLLATEKPIDRESYEKVMSCQSGWCDYGIIIVDEIEKHLKNQN